MRWDKVNAIYQIYPRSFQDSDGDGIGDIAGITSRLEYLKGNPESLGVDAIWISPFYPSPMRDFGYDVSDYRDVDPLFGSIEDMDTLIEKAHSLGIKVMIDMVPNHTSSDHPWFIEAMESKDSVKRKYYIFKDETSDGQPPNNWLSVFGGSAWEYDEKTQQYYMHSFLKEQPDLNWENKDVQREFADILRFWFDRGVDGFRVDAIRWMGKDTDFKNDPENPNYSAGQDDPYHALRHENSRNSEQLKSYLGHLAAVAAEYDDKIMLWEDHLDNLTSVKSQVNGIYSVNIEKSAPFNFQIMHIPLDARTFARTIEDYLSFIPDGGRSYYCFSNHDESRLASRFGVKSARMLSVMQLMLPGTPVLYYGQEIGMRDGEVPPEKIQDPFELRVPGKGLGRDPERTPMQWNDSKNAGFSEGDTTWLPLAEGYSESNVELQTIQADSFLYLHKKMLQLRSNYPVIGSMNYTSGSTTNDMFSFWRADDKVEFLVALNFSNKEILLDAPAGGELEVSAQFYDYENLSTLKPHDGIVIRYAKG